MPRASRPVPGLELHRIAPLSVPGQSRPLLRRFNRAALSRGLRFHARRCGMRDPLVWLSYPHPDLVSIIETLEPAVLVYDCVDNWAEFARGYANIAAAEEALMRRADLVLATVPRLVERAARFNERSFLVPNGVDVEYYRSVLDGDCELPAELAAIPSPRIGFVGNIAEWIDLELLERLAASHPRWHFVLIGRYQSLLRRPERGNLHWLGYRGYELIPRYLAGVDVCILPFLVNPLTRDADPLKLYEYLASGRPVVSTPMPRAEDFDGLLRIARGPEEFGRAIERALAEGHTDHERRVAAAREHSWTARLEQLRGIFAETLDIDLVPLAGGERPAPPSVA
jgi:glycosyltransferase involved in cell wall biosynthesis